MTSQGLKYDLLSAQDNSFLLLETDALRMHVSSTQIFERGPLATPEGGVDIDAIKAFVGAVLHRIPRYRQKLMPIPFERRYVWVDDPHFEIGYHVRHSGLPRPGSEAQLKNLASRVMSQRLDRRRPLWEIWVVEGLERNRFAIVSKIHHCMIDGSSGVDISTILQSVTPDRTIPEMPPYVPRPLPTPFELVRDAAARRAVLPLRIASGLLAFGRETEDLRAELGVRARALRDMLAAQLSRASETPINGRIGPHCRFDWHAQPIEELKAIRRAFGCTINDAVLTILTGAFRTYLSHRGVDPAKVDFRVEAPVSVRSDEERGRLGNRISAWSVPLPLGEEEPKRQLETIRRTTRALKASRQALGVDLMMQAMEVLPTTLLSLGMRAARGSMNSIVTNVPGPQFPLYLLGARMLACYPQVPLLPDVGLGIALLSYDGSVCWGFNADPGRVPDLATFVAQVREASEAMAAAAKRERPTPRRAAARPRRSGAHGKATPREAPAP